MKGFPGGTNGKESACQCRRHKRRWFNVWVWKTPEVGNIFLPGKSNGQKSLAATVHGGHKESNRTED